MKIAKCCWPLTHHSNHRNALEGTYELREGLPDSAQGTRTKIEATIPINSISHVTDASSAVVKTEAMGRMMNATCLVESNNATAGASSGDTDAFETIQMWQQKELTPEFVSALGPGQRSGDGCVHVAIPRVVEQQI